MFDFSLSSFLKAALLAALVQSAAWAQQVQPPQPPQTQQPGSAAPSSPAAVQPVTRLPGPVGSEPPMAQPGTPGSPSAGMPGQPPQGLPSLPLRVGQPLEGYFDRWPQPSEFERLVTQANHGVPVWRLGSRTRHLDAAVNDRVIPARVPPHYVLQVGDEVSIHLWGSVDAQWLVRVDRAGRIALPRVGPVAVAGETAGGLEERLRSRLSTVFRNFELAAAVTDVSPLRVHITGFVEKPGDYIVPGLTTISGALALAQGPAAGGSWRRVRLVRDDRTVVSFDSYTLLREGQRRDDRLLQPGDVLFVEPAGPQAAVLGSVNRVAVFEFLPGETVADLLQLAGGFSSVAERQVVVVERLSERSTLGAVELQLPRDGTRVLGDGDILRVKSQVAATAPTQQRNKRVLVEGEVKNPGEYLLPADAKLADAIAAAGGPTPAAFVFGTSLRRESVRLTQEANYERALNELEGQLARAAAERATRSEGAVDSGTSWQTLVARLRARRPEGRVVLETTPDSRTLPAQELEDGDRILLPANNQSVGVFGSVYNSGSFVHAAGRDLGHYLKRAGGPSAGADYASSFVVRANGSVLSASQDGSFFNRTGRFEAEPALPGDTVFVPEELFRGRLVQGFKDWTQILYQLGVGLAAIRTVR
jgi:protein involved in polysaccharide export with SLBB domain